MEHFHNKCYLHRDVKPDNFVIGIGDSVGTVFLIDYGLAKRYRDANTMVHISYRDHKKLTGTTRYASLNTHLGAEQSRRDDLECLAHTLIYLLKGDLPWQGMLARNKQEKYDKIRDKKMNTPVETLCNGLDPEFGIFLTYCRSLKFEEKPDYSRLHKLFRDLYYRKKYDAHFEFDWIRLKLGTTLPEDRDMSSSDSNQAENEPTPPPPGNILQVPAAGESDGMQSSVSLRSVAFSFSNRAAVTPPLEGTKDSTGTLPEVAGVSLQKKEGTLTSAFKEAAKKEAEGRQLTLDSSRCNFSPEDIVEDHSVYGTGLVCNVSIEDVIPDEKPLNSSIFIPQCTYINNVRHWDRYRGRGHNVFSTMMMPRGMGTDYPLRKRVFASESRVMIHNMQAHSGDLRMCAATKDTRSNKEESNDGGVTIAKPSSVFA